jgi:hypothetical protein
MAASKPLWRQTFDAVERRVAKPAEKTTRTDVFNDAVSVALKSKRTVQRAIERRTRRVLHMVNMPAATDVKRLSEQVAALHREVRSLQRELDKAEGRPARPRSRSAKG